MRTRGFEVVRAYKDKNIHLPQRKTKASAGYDIEAAVDMVLLPQTVALIPTGLKAYMLENEYLGIHIRSGFSIKQTLSLVNSQGIIDADYYNNAENEGHIIIAVMNHSTASVQITKGMRIAQGIFYQYLLADDDIADTKKVLRRGGMGSTGE